MSQSATAYWLLITYSISTFAFLIINLICWYRKCGQEDGGDGKEDISQKNAKNSLKIKGISDAPGMA